MRNGFTLVELLAVIIILSAIALITFVATGSIINNSKNNLSEIQISKIEEAAEMYYLKEGMNFDDGGFDSCVNVNKLLSKGYLESNQILDPKTNKEITGSVLISYNSNKYSYKYQDSSCQYLCSAVTEDTKTTGNIPQGKYKPGDEYICEVKDGTKFNFFILSTKDNLVNLILNGNIYYDANNGVESLATATNQGKVAWYKDASSNSFGPVTAMTYLHNATKNWHYVPNIQMNYTDEGNTGSYGYGTIKTENNITKITKKDGTTVTATFENLKARMPMLSEVSDYDSINKKNAYLYDYLESNNNIQSNPINGIRGYWILSSSVNSNDVGTVNFSGSLIFPYGDDYSRYGVRPVISIPKSYIE